MKKVDKKAEKKVEKKEKVIEKPKRNNKIVVEIDKKSLVIAIVAVIAVIIIFVISNGVGNRSDDKNSSNGTNETASNTVNSDNPLLESNQNTTMVGEMPQVSYAEFKKDLADSKVTIIMLGYDDCYWCRQEKEIIRAYLYENKNVNVKYLDISKITEKEWNELISLHSELEKFGTPTFIAVKNGKVTKVDKDGARGFSGLTKLFKDMGAM